MSDSELVDVVDRVGNVVETVTRAEMRERNLRHRAVYIVVRTSAGEVVVHRRADWKDVYPGAWDLCFGGVLAAGEGWYQAARRELAEEAGVDAPVTLLAEGMWEGESGESPVVGRVYLAEHDGPFPCPDGEVVELATVPAGELAAWVGERQCCPDSVALVLPLVGRW